MLVLKREVGQAVLVGPSIEIVVAEICPSRVTLAISHGQAVHLLDRYYGEPASIAGVTVRAARRRAGVVRLGIDAPGMQIVRRELLEAAAGN